MKTNLTLEEQEMEYEAQQLQSLEGDKRARVENIIVLYMNMELAQPTSCTRYA